MTSHRIRVRLKASGYPGPALDLEVDKMKRRITTIALLGLLMLFGALLAGNLGLIRTASGQDARPTEVPIGTEVQLTTYAFLPGNNRSDIEAWENEGVISINDAKALYDAVPDGPGTAVYVNEQGLQALDDAWLKAKYATGVAFGGVGIALSELGNRVGSNPDVPDLDMSRAEGKVQVSFSFEFHNSARRAHYFYTDYWVDLTAAPLVLERAVITMIR